MAFETLADGSQIVREIPPGDFGVTAKYKLCVSQFSTVKIEPDRMSEVRFDLLPGGLVSGTVVDRSGAPVPKTRVAWMASSTDSNAEVGPSAETDAEGRYRLEGVPLGSFRLHVYHLHFKHWIRENLSLRDPSDVLVVDAVLERGTRVSGRVVDEQGTAIPKAMVMGLNEATFAAETDPEGRFTLYGLGEQPVSVSVTARGFGRKFVPAVAPDSSEVLIVLRKGAAVSARLDASPVPATFAVFLSSYEHAAGRDVRVPYRSEKDPKGGFVIRDVDPGIYRVEVDAPGYETLDKPSVTLTPGATETVSIRLKKSP
jgi:hypothetical protein